MACDNPLQEAYNLKSAITSAFSGNDGVAVW